MVKDTRKWNVESVRLMSVVVGLVYKYICIIYIL